MGSIHIDLDSFLYFSTDITSRAVDENSVMDTTVTINVVLCYVAYARDKPVGDNLGNYVNKMMSLNSFCSIDAFRQFLRFARDT